MSSANSGFPGVYLEEVPSSVRPIGAASTAVAVFLGNVQIKPKGAQKRIYGFDEFKSNFVAQSSGINALTPLQENLADAVGHYFLNGGKECYVVPVGEPEPSPLVHWKAEIEGNLKGAEGQEALLVLETKGVFKKDDPIRVSAICVMMTADNSNGLFRLELRSTHGLDEHSCSGDIEIYDDLTLSSVEARCGSSKIAAVSLKSADLNDKTVKSWSKSDVLDFTPEDNGSPSSSGTPQISISTAHLSNLDGLADVSLIAAPGFSDVASIDACISYCKERGDCFFIADGPNEEVTALETVRNSINASAFGALYYPWLKLSDGKSAPPSGCVAGVYAQIDSRRGVWKAPAGLEAGLIGPVDVSRDVPEAEHGKLNVDSRSVCVIRRHPQQGLVLWGARTLNGNEGAYKYISVRRTANMIKRSIREGIQWAVFEGNNEQLWSSLRVNIDSFMNGLFRAGAFQGGKASEAYFVRCGLGQTMKQADIDLGKVIVEVGFAPLKPAEFVVVRIEQMAAQ